MKGSVIYALTAFVLAVSDDTHGIGMTDTTVQLRTVTIDTIAYSRIGGARNKATLIEFNDTDGRKASEILSDFSGIYLKNYGVGQLSSISFRGSSAAQTELQWNGIKLNNPSTGQVDLSLFDIAADDKLTISDRGSNSTGIGGVVTIDNDLRLKAAKGIYSDNTIRLGSFGEHSVSTRNVYRFRNFMGATRVSYLAADNDFTYVNSSMLGAPLMRQGNAATRLFSVMQQLQYSFPKAVILRADLWVTDADRQLPPVMTSDQSSERQWDRSYRAIFHISGRRAKFRYTLRSAYLYDRLRYVDTMTSIDSRSVSHAIRNVFTGRYEFWNSLILEGRAHYDHEMAGSSGYDHVWSRDLAGITLEMQYYHRSGFNAKANAGLEIQGNRLLPISASLSIGYLRKFNKEVFTLEATGSHAYRVPGLNDLYWSTGGSPLLRPEKAWKSGLHIAYTHSFWLNILTDGFYNYVTDWIQWSPEQSSAIWTAQNLKRVLSRGVTAEIKMQSRQNVTSGRLAVSGGISYTYTNTISLDPISANDNSKSKQLIYVPLHNLVASVQVQYRHFYIRASQVYTGERYITTDNSQALQPYSLTHLEVGKDFNMQSQHLCLSFRISNITNQQYQMVTQRPMPGRGFEGTLRINLAK